MEKRFDYTFEFEEKFNHWYVVEHNGMLKTGPFGTPELAIDWFRRELDVELVPKVEASHD